MMRLTKIAIIWAQLSDHSHKHSLAQTSFFFHCLLNHYYYYFVLHVFILLFNCCYYCFVWCVESVCLCEWIGLSIYTTQYQFIMWNTCISTIQANHTCSKTLTHTHARTHNHALGSVCCLFRFSTGFRFVLYYNLFNPFSLFFRLIHANVIWSMRCDRSHSGRTLHAYIILKFNPCAHFVSFAQIDSMDMCA